MSADHTGEDAGVQMSWSGATAEHRDARGNPPAPRQRARLLEARGIERPRSVDPHVREPVVDVVPRERNEALARALNVTIAAAGLLLTLPVLVFVAIVIKFSSRGPILYTQTRVGLDRRWRNTLALREIRLDDLGGQVFTIYKFRTMHVDAEGGSGAIWATANDPRTTTFGKYLRRYRIDEIPQFWNVLRGDMNIVGPRPERPSIVARLREDIPEYRFRQRVRPGLTGLAQINQNYDSSLDDVRSKVKWDLQYLRTQGFWLDVRIMIKTFPAVLLRFQGW